MTELMAEAEWVEEYLSGRTWGWEELIQCGRADTDQLEDGELKQALLSFITLSAQIEQKLDALGYEAG